MAPSFCLVTLLTIAKRAATFANFQVRAQWVEKGEGHVWQNEMPSTTCDHTPPAGNGGERTRWGLCKRYETCP